MGDAEDARVSRFEGLGTARREELGGLVYHPLGLVDAAGKQVDIPRPAPWPALAAAAGGGGSARKNRHCYSGGPRRKPLRMNGKVQQLLEHKGCASVRAVLGLCGSLTGCQQVAAQAEAQHVKVIPHNPLCLSLRRRGSAAQPRALWLALVRPYGVSRHASERRGRGDGTPEVIYAGEHFFALIKPFGEEQT